MTASIGAIAPIAAVIGTGAGGVFADRDCASGGVATGANIRAGGSVDALGLICSTLTAN
jgi:hypothetical protein